MRCPECDREVAETAFDGGCPFCGEALVDHVEVTDGRRTVGADAIGGPWLAPVTMKSVAANFRKLAVILRGRLRAPKQPWPEFAALDDCNWDWPPVWTAPFDWRID